MKTQLNLLATWAFLATVTAGLGQPLITQQPQSWTNAVGTTATFTVAATGTEPLAYQWQKLSGNWADLTGCTATNLCLTNIQTSHAGDYRVVITNVESAVTSDVAHLTVLGPTLQGAASAYSVAENAGTVCLTVRRVSDTNAAVTVDYARQWHAGRCPPPATQLRGPGVLAPRHRRLQPRARGYTERPRRRGEQRHRGHHRPLHRPPLWLCLQELLCRASWPP